MAEETQNETTELTETVEDNVENIDVAEAESELKPHPAHEKLLSELPEAWHQKILPHLQEQDKFYQQEMEKYTPYKEFAEAGVSPEILRGGMNLAKAIETQPMDVYSSLTDYLEEQGFIAKDAKQAAKEIMEEESGEDFEEIFDDEEIPSALRREIEELKQFRNQQEDYVRDQMLEKETQKHLEILETDMEQIKQKYSISEAHEIAIYDLMNAAINAGRDISVEQAAQQLGQMIGGFTNAASGSEPAPTVIGSAGGAGVQAQNLEIPKDDAAKKRMLENMFAEYKKASQQTLVQKNIKTLYKECQTGTSPRTAPKRVRAGDELETLLILLTLRRVKLWQVREF